MSPGRLLVVEKAAHALGVLDLASGERVGGIGASGVTPHEVAASRDGRRAYLPVYGDANVGEPGIDGSTIDVVDLDAIGADRAGDSQRARRTIDLGAPSRPHDVALGADGRLYVTAELQRAVLVLDPAEPRVVGSLPTGADESHMVALTSDARRACTVNVGPGSVSVIDVASGALERIVPLGTRVNRISITPDDRFAVTADQRAARLAFVSLDDGTVDWVELPSRGYGTAATADGSELVIAMRPTDQVAILDLARRSIRAVVDVPPTPQRVVVVGERAYVTCDASDVVVEIDLPAARVRRRLATGAGPDGIAWVRTTG